MSTKGCEEGEKRCCKAKNKAKTSLFFLGSKMERDLLKDRRVALGAEGKKKGCGAIDCLSPTLPKGK